MASDLTKVLLFLPNSEGGSDVLGQAVEAALGPGRLELVCSLSELRDRLRKPLEISVAVLVAQTEIELAKLASLAPLLDNTRVVLILPDADDATVARGHSLRPRVVGWGQDFLSQIPAIIVKMIAGPS